MLNREFSTWRLVLFPLFLVIVSFSKYLLNAIYLPDSVLLALERAMQSKT